MNQMHLNLQTLLSPFNFCDHGDVLFFYFQYHVEPSPIPHQAPVLIRNDSDPVNDDLMRQLAAEMGEEWRKIAITLNISKARIQAIIRNAQITDSTDEDARYQMLITWLKKMPKSIDKVRDRSASPVH